MRKLFILAALAACCLAVPVQNKEDNSKEADLTLLQRPSPINPDIPSDPKPAEKITMITDPVEIAKHKRETDTKAEVHATPLLPTVQPEAEEIKHQRSEHESITEHVETHQQHHRQKRDEKSTTDANEATSTLFNADGLDKPTPPPRKRRSASSTATPTVSKDKQHIAAAPAVPASQRHRLRREDSKAQYTPNEAVPIAPLIYHERNSQSAFDGQRAAASNGYVQPQTLPQLNYDQQAHTHFTQHTDSKRDIPVPLVPKHQHPEESPKENESKDKAEQSQKEADHNKADVLSSSTTSAEKQSTTTSTTTTEHPALRPHPAPVAELFERPKL